MSLTKQTWLPLILCLPFVLGCFGGDDDSGTSSTTVEKNSGGSDDGDEADPDAESKAAIEAVFATFRESHLNREWQTMLGTLTPASRSVLLGYSAIGAFRIASDDAALKAELLPIIERCGIDMTVLETLPDSEKPSDIDPIAKQIGDSVRPDQQGSCFAELMTWIESQGDDVDLDAGNVESEASESDSEPEADEIDTLENTRIGFLPTENVETARIDPQGWLIDKPTAQITIQYGSDEDNLTERTVRFRFALVDQVWQIDLLATDPVGS